MAEMIANCPPTSPPTASSSGTLVLLINLDRAPGRLATTGESLRANGISFNRVSAVDGAKLTLPMPGVDPELYRKCHGRTLRLGEVGCYLSHLRAMQTFLDTAHDYCVILEDDAQIVAGAKDIIDHLTAANLHGFDVVRLQLRRWGLNFKAAQVSENHQLRVMATRVTGSMAYMINRRAAQRYLDRLLPMVVPLDHAFDRPWQLGLRIAFMMPALFTVSEDGLESQIELPGAARAVAAKRDKVGLLGKVSVLRWRTGTELARFGAAAVEGVRGLRIARWQSRPRCGARLQRPR
jgi:glycosyl transferase, family 25